MSPLPERSSSWSLGALNRLADPRGVRFGTGNYLVCLEHWVALGWCQQWRHGKSVQFAPVWSALRSLPTPPPHDPAAQHTYEGLVLGSRTTRGLAAVTWTAPPAATTSNNANAADPRRGPQPRLEPQAGDGGMLWGAQNFRRYVCVCVCLIFRTLRLKFLV